MMLQNNVAACRGYTPFGLYRLVLALLVFVAHISGVYKLNTGEAYWGALGVLLFFTLSGYIIFSCYEAFYVHSLGNFIINRFLKIYPVLWACLGISAAIIFLADGTTVGDLSLAHFDATAAFFAITAVGAPLYPYTWSTLGQAWSVHVELQFYIIAFAIFWISERKAPTADKTIPAGLAGVVFLLFYIFIVLSQSQARFYGDLRYAPFFSLGASVYFLLKSQLMSRVAWVFVVASLAFAIHFILSTVNFKYMGFELEALRVRTAAYFILLLGILAACTVWKPGLALTRLDKVAGNLTYPLYLVHWPIISLVLYYGQRSGFLIALLILIACLAAAQVLDIGVQRPLMGLRDRVRGYVLFR